MIQIARNGEVLGAVNEVEFSEGIAQGRILATDHWWKEGMDAWAEVGAGHHWNLGHAPAHSPEAGEAETDIVKKSRKKSSAAKSEKTNEALTQRQVEYMLKLGITIPEACTKEQASELIGVVDTPAKAIRKENWKEPATQKQLDYLVRLGGEYPEPCDKQEASRLIVAALGARDAENWGQQPATQRQREMLKKAGVKVSVKLTQEEVQVHWDTLQFIASDEKCEHRRDSAYEARAKRMEKNPFWAAHEDVIDAEEALKEAVESKKRQKSEFQEGRKQLSGLKKEETRIDQLINSQKEDTFDISSLVRHRVELGMIRAKIDLVSKLEKPDSEDEFFDEREALRETEKYRVGLWKVSFSMDIDISDEMDFFV